MLGMDDLIEYAAFLASFKNVLGAESDNGFEKDRRVAEQEQCRLEMERQTLANPGLRLVAALADERQRASISAPLSSLKVITFPELILDNHHRGRVLYGRLCVKPLKMSAACTVLEDENGRGVRLTIYNGLSSKASAREVERRFPMGSRVAIKEPFYKMCTDGKTAVRVDNPADISTCVDSIHEGQNSPMDLSDADAVKQLDAIRLEGNRLFGERNWMGALNSYSQCINEAVGKPEKNVSKSITFQENFNRVVLLAYSNRAEARLRLEHYEDALNDAEEALKLEPKDVKTLTRQGRAAHGMGLFEKSCKIFEVALQQSPQEKSILKNLEASKIAYEQSQNGLYKTSDYFLSGCKSGEAPPCADFVGPVEIRRVSYSSGRRGLFVTKGVKANQVLLVSNPLSTVWKESSDINQPMLNVMAGVLTKRTMGNFKEEGKDAIILAHDEDLVTALINRVMTSKRKMAQLYSLVAVNRKQESQIPSIELFRPGSEWIPPHADNLTVDVDRIRDITKLNALVNHHDMLMKSDLNHAPEGYNSGIWALPSFANHSCAPNCVPLYIGDVLFFLAAADLAEGEELTIPYFHDLFESVESRQKRAVNGLFTCKCERCIFEETLKPQLRKINKAMPGLLEAVEAEILQEGSPGRWAKELAQVVDDLELVIQVRKVKLKPKQESWIRGAFLDAYLGKYRVAAALDDAQSRIAALKIVVYSMSSICVTAIVLKMAATLLRDVEQTYFKHSQMYHQTEERVLGIYRVAFGKQPSKTLHKLMRSYCPYPFNSC